MPNIDITNLDSLTQHQFRLMYAIEYAMRNHEYAPLPLINQIARVPAIHNRLGDLSRYGLVEHIGGSSDGYKLTFQGLDYLAFKVLQKRKLIRTPERKIGVGKEAEVWVCSTWDEDRQVVVKLHKLGLNSFKTVRTSRNYSEKQLPFYVLSQKAASREAGFGTALLQRGFPVPVVYGVARHAVCMQLVEGIYMSRLRGIGSEQAAYLGWRLFDLMVGMLRVGVVHGDCNEYNCIVEIDYEKYIYPAAEDALSEEHNEELSSDAGSCMETRSSEPIRELPEEMQVFRKITIIDFPQLIQSTDEQAGFQFDRDISSIEGFINRRFLANVRFPRFADVIRDVVVSSEITASEAFARGVLNDLPQATEEDFEPDEEGDGETESRDFADKYKPVLRQRTINVYKAARRQVRRADYQRSGCAKRMEKGVKKAQRDRYGAKDDY